MVAAAGLALPLASAGAAPACPDVAGRYSLADPGPALADARQVLGLGQQPEVERGGRHLLLESADAGRVLRVLALEPDALKTEGQTPITLIAARDYDCRDGWIVFRRPVPAWRRGDRTEPLTGSSTVRLRGEGGNGLQFSITFKGRASATLYSYESARVAVPVPFSGRTVVDSLLWPPAQAQRRPDAQEVAQRAAAEGLRARLVALLAPADLGSVTPGPGGALVQVRASRSNELLASEDRLLAAGVAYEFEREPQWYDNAWHGEVRVLEGGGTTAGGRPSAFRIAAEINRLLPPTAHADQVRRVGPTYVAEVTLLGGTQPEPLLDTLAARSRLIGRVVAMPADAPDAGPSRRIVRWLVTLRQ